MSLGCLRLVLFCLCVFGVFSGLVLVLLFEVGFEILGVFGLPYGMVVDLRVGGFCV